MKKLSVASFVIFSVSILLVSCGKSADPAQAGIITANTPIENSAQSAKVCQPFIKYLECSLEKAPEAKKATARKALEDTKARIANDDPARVAQTCDTYMKVMRDNSEMAFKNGCTLDDGTVAPTSKVTPAPVPPKTEPVVQPKK